MHIIALRDRDLRALVDATLGSQGIPHRWDEIDGALHLAVREDLADEACGVLALQLAEEPSGGAAVRGKSWWLRPEVACASGAAALLATFHGVVAGRRSWYAAGALPAGSGRSWQWLTAATLHADWAHAVGNAAFLVVLGWAVGERIGAGMMLWAALACAVVGNGAYALIAATGVTVGASGATFGLLGVAAGHAARWRDGQILGGRGRLRIVGAGILLLAFTGFGERANLHAHIAGFACGLLLGVVLPQRPLGWAAQALSALVVACLLACAWQAVL